MARKPKIQKIETEVKALPITDEEVISLLKKKGLKPGNMLNDKLSKASIKFFQKTNGLKITSEINDETLAKLKG